MKMLIVGEAPAAKRPEWSVLQGPSGERLARLFGCDWREVADAVNLLDWHQRADANGESKFPAPEAKAAARMLLRVHPGLNGVGPACPLVLLLGRRVAHAFGVTGVAYFETTVVCSRTAAEPVQRPAVVVPHPSGRSRWWNEPANRTAAGVWFEKLTKKLETGWTGF